MVCFSRMMTNCGLKPRMVKSRLSMVPRKVQNSSSCGRPPLKAMKELENQSFGDAFSRSQNISQFGRKAGHFPEKNRMPIPGPPSGPGNKGTDTNPIQDPPGIAAQCHQVEFPPLGKFTHLEMVDTRPDLQGPEGMLDQGTTKANDSTIVIGHAPVMAINDIRMFPAHNPAIGFGSGKTARGQPKFNIWCMIYFTHVGGGGAESELHYNPNPSPVRGSSFPGHERSAQTQVLQTLAGGSGMPIPS